MLGPSKSVCAHQSAPELALSPVDLSANIDRGGLLLSSGDSEFISLSNMPDELSLQKENKEHQSISFSGISVIIDTMIKCNSRAALRVHRPDIETAVLSGNIPGLLESIGEGPSRDKEALHVALSLSVEKNKPETLRELLELCTNGEASSLKNLLDQDLLYVGALEGHRAIVELLVQKGGCDPHAWGSNNSLTPLHAAVSRGHLDILKYFVEEVGANIHIGAEETSLMYSAVSSNQAHIVSYLLEQKANHMGVHKFTETALHVSAELNHVRIASILLSSGTTLVDALRGEVQRETALHIAAKNGYRNMASLLLSAGADPNARNGKNETPLHLAGKVLAKSLMKLLIHRGADIEAKDVDGRPPLHCIVNSEHQGATECMRLLIQNKVNLNSADNNGVTALHLAAVNYKTSRVNLLITHGADLCTKNKNGKAALHFAIKYVPSCISAIKERMDASIKMENPGSDINCKIKMDFNTLIPSCNNFQSEVSLFTELLNVHGVDNERSSAKILLHPLAEAFLHIKWNQIKWLYYIFILFSHFIYSVTYSLYAILVYKSLCSPNLDSSTSYQTCGFDTQETAVQLAIAAWIFLVIFNVLYICKETTKFIHLGSRYLREYESLLNICIIVLFLLMSFHTDPFGGSITLARWQYHAAAFGVFSTWLFLMLLIGKVPRFGKYVEMFKTVSKTFLNFLIAYVFLFVAFVLTFYLLIPSHVAFNGSLPSAFVKVLVMMLGELEYDDLYYPEKETFRILNRTTGEGVIESQVEAQAFPFMAHIFVAIFIVLISIIIMNLLFGLAVADIQELYKTAKLQQMIQQVQLISYMESVLLSPIFEYLPDFLQMFLRKVIQGVQGNYRYVKVVEPNNFQDTLLPVGLKKRLMKDLEGKYGPSQQVMMANTTVCLGTIKMQLEELKDIILKMQEAGQSEERPKEEEPRRKTSTSSSTTLKIQHHPNKKRFSGGCLDKIEKTHQRRPSNSSAKMLVEDDDFDSDILDSGPVTPDPFGLEDDFVLSFPSEPKSMTGGGGEGRVSLGRIQEHSSSSSSMESLTTEETLPK